MHVVVCMQVISHIHTHRTPMLRPGLRQFPAGKMLGICLARLKLRLGLDTTRVRGLKAKPGGSIHIHQPDFKWIAQKSLTALNFWGPGWRQVLGACCSGLIGIKVLSLPMFRYVLMFLSRLPSPFRLLSPRLPGFPAILGFVDYHLLIVFKVVCCIKAWEGSMPGKAQCCMRTLSAWEGLN